MRLAITTLLALILFAAGAAGTYFLMPALAPENVIVARRYQDSIRAVMDSANAPIRTAALASDTLSLPADTLDSQLDLIAAASVLPPLASEGSPAAAALVPGGEAEGGEAESDESKGDAERQAQAERARELAGVLVKLEDSELRAIVAHLDADVLQSVYHQASARGKTKLLQAIPPEKAALFVRALVRPAQRADG